MPLTPPEVFDNVPSRDDSDNFAERADLAWANLQEWLNFFTELTDALNEGLAAPISALTLSQSGVILGRIAGGGGISEELTPAQASALLQGDGMSASAAGFRGIPLRSVSANTTVTAADVGGQIYHPGADTTPRTWTIPANASLALPIGAAVTFVNDTSAGSLSIAITSDTLILAGAGTTGTRTLAANGIATAVKMTSTRWIISGTGLT